MKQETLVILKLPASRQDYGEATVLINRELSAMGLVTRYEHVVLGSSAWKALYPGLPNEILNTLIAQFADRKVGVIFVEGEDAVALAASRKGSHNNPKLCHKDSFRRRLSHCYGFRSMLLYVAKGKRLRVYDNYVHIPKNAREAKRNLRIVRQAIVKGARLI